MKIPRLEILFVLALVPLPMAAQDHDHGATGAETGKPPEQLGKVHFQTSCAPAVSAKFDRAVAGFQFAEDHPWITALNVHYHLGLDGLSLLRWSSSMMKHAFDRLYIQEIF